jgi:hypothetical protein
MELMRTLVDEATSVYNGFGDQYHVEFFANNEDNIHINCIQYYVDRGTVAEMMAKSNHFVVPYILSHEEKALLDKAEKDAPQIAENGDVILLTDNQLVPKSEEYISWKQVKDLKNTVSMKAYCEQYCPEILEDKSAAELRCMEETPFLAEWKITDPSGTVMTKTSTAYNQNGGDTVKKTVSQLLFCGQSGTTGTMYIDNLSIQVK